MYSQCPDCQTRFRVTAEALRVAHGTVRCGRCGSAFDALERLSDTIPPPGPAADGTIAVRMPAGAAPLQSGERAAAADFHFSAADLERVFVDARDWQRQYGPDGAAPASGISTSEPSELVVDESESLEDITLEGERIQIDVPPGFEDDEDVVEALEHEVSDDLDATDRFRALDPTTLEHDFIDDTESEDHESEQEAAEILKLADAIRAEEELAAAAAAQPAIEPPRPAFAPTSQPAPLVPERTKRSVETIAPRRWQVPAREVDIDALPTGRRARSEADEDETPKRRGLAWTLASFVLALALLAQLTHYFRQDLVRHPQIGPLLGDVYARLGLDLAPNWDPRAFEIRQWGDSGTAPAANRMSVQASIRNKAAFAQPYPLLRLELEDRFGAPVATRDFEPSEYLKVPSLATRMLAAGASADAGLEIVDPGADAVGYRLDVCLRESAEILRCAQGPG